MPSLRVVAARGLRPILTIVEAGVSPIQAITTFARVSIPVFNLATPRDYLGRPKFLFTLNFVRVGREVARWACPLEWGCLGVVTADNRGVPIVKAVFCLLWWQSGWPGFGGGSYFCRLGLFQNARRKLLCRFRNRMR
jgi:hypothetical protein